jgi:WD40 repeat protein
MPALLLRLPLLAAALLLALPASADPPPPADPADDPLPEGAKVRYGVSRPILRANPAVGLVPPGYTNFLAPILSGGVRRYDLGTGRPLAKVTSAAGLVGPGVVAMSFDGKRAAVARPGILTVVDAATGKQLLAVKPPEGVVIVGTPGASLSADGKVLAYGGRGKEGKGEVVVWDVDKNEQLARVEAAQAAPVFPCLTRDGKTLATHGPPLAAPTVREPAFPGAPMPKVEPIDPDVARTAQVWEVEGGRELFRARVTGMGGMAVASAFSPDGELLALSAGDGPVDLWEVKTGKRLHTLLGRKGQGVKVAFSLDGKTIASVGPDYRIQRWTSDGKPIGVTDPPPGILIAQVSGLAFADNERAIAWVTAAQFCCAWEAPSGRLLSPLMDHAAAIRSVAFPEGDKDLFTSGVDGRVFRWDLPTGQMLEAVQLHPARIPGQPLIRPVVNISADATRATWLRTGAAPTEIFDMATGTDLFCVPPPSAPPSPVSLAISPEGLKLVTLSRQADAKRAGSCVVWDLTTQQRVAEFEIPASATTTAPAAALSPSGTKLVLVTSTRNAEGKLVLLIAGFDLKTGKKLAEAEDPTVSGTLYVSVADDTTAVLATAAGRLWSVDYVAGRVGPDIDKLPRPPGGEVSTYGVAVFSPDGKRFAIGVGGDQFETYGVRVYDWPQKKPLHTFIGHVGPVSAVRFSPDSKFLASGAQDTSVLLWDLAKIPDRK